MMRKLIERSRNSELVLFVDVLDLLRATGEDPNEVCAVNEKNRNSASQDSDLPWIRLCELFKFRPKETTVVLRVGRIPEPFRRAYAELMRKHGLVRSAVRSKQLLRIPIRMKDRNGFDQICRHISEAELQDAVCISIMTKHSRNLGEDEAIVEDSIIRCNDLLDFRREGSQRLQPMITEQRKAHLGVRWQERAFEAFMNDFDGDRDRAQLALFDKDEPADFSDPFGNDVMFGGAANESTSSATDAPFTAIEETAVEDRMEPTPPLEWEDETDLHLSVPLFGRPSLSPRLMSRHWLVVGETGAGKTKSVVLPLLNALIRYEIKA